MGNHIIQEHSVTCHLAMEIYRPLLPQLKLVLDLATPEGRMAEMTWWWLYPKIVYLPKTVTYLRNNPTVLFPSVSC